MRRRRSGRPAVLAPLLVLALWFAPSHGGPSPEMDLALRRLAYGFASTRLVDDFHQQRGALKSVCAALKLPATDCGATPQPSASPTPSSPSPSLTFYVRPDGSDTAAGTAAAPFQTPHRAQAAIRAARRDASASGTPSSTSSGMPAATVFFSPGRYELRKSLVLTAQDSNTTWAAVPGSVSGSVEFSGGVDLGTLDWALRPATSTRAAFLAAKLPTAVVEKLAERSSGSGDQGGVQSLFASLFVDGRRQIRARWPNANAERDLFPKGYATGRWGAFRALGQGRHVELASPSRIKDSGGGGEHFDKYSYLEGGPSRLWQTAAWASDAGVESFSFDDLQDYNHKQYESLTALTDEKTGGRSRLGRWGVSNGDNDVWIHTLNDGFWGNWMFRLDSTAPPNATTGRLGFADPIHEGGGGWQDQAGAGWQDHCVWFAEGVLAELDMPGEWHYDPSTSTLRLIPDDGAPVKPSSMSGRRLVVPVLESIVRMEGTLSAPVQGVTLRGLTLRDTLPTYTKRYTIPGPGDWSIYPSGAVFLQGTLGVVIEQCLVTGTGGNGIFLSRFNKDHVIRNSEFASIGDSAIASAGFANFTDATGGDFPHDGTVEGNHIHDLGVYGKQTSAYFQTLSCRNTVRNNVMYHGPRAAINLNDGLGGGTVVEGNLLFGMVRETNDHGPLNSWDRVPFVTNMGDPTDPSGVRPMTNHIRRNLIINSGSSGLGTTGGVWNLDHDDGSAYYEDSFNVLVYAGTKNYLGDHKTFHDNLIVHPDAGLSSTPYCHHECSNWFAADRAEKAGAPRSGGARPAARPSWGETWANNTCFLLGTAAGGVAGGSAVRFDALVRSNLHASVPVLANNTYHLAGAGTSQYVPTTDPKQEITWAALKKEGFEEGSTLDADTAGTEEVVALAKGILQISSC